MKRKNKIAIGFATGAMLIITLLIVCQARYSPIKIEVVSVTESDKSIKVLIKVENANRGPILVNYDVATGKPYIKADAVNRNEGRRYDPQPLIEPLSDEEVLKKINNFALEYILLDGGSSVETTLEIDLSERETISSFEVFYYNASEQDSIWSDKLAHNITLSDWGWVSSLKWYVQRGLEQNGGYRRARTEAKPLITHGE